MAKQYWVGEFFVDLSRNQISQLGQSQTLPPKALLVLTHLAENTGRVVSYDELLDNVWPNSVVTPNTLQRAVAQLRKALGENSKAPGIIKTHAKQGYSLESEVNWHKNQAEFALPPEHAQPYPMEEVTREDRDTHESPNRSRKTGWGIGGLLTCCVAITALLLTLLQRDSVFSITAIQAMTATDNSEFYAIYSADSEYIIFNRYDRQTCLGRIWAKHIATQQETLLTPAWGGYRSLSLSPDGTQLVFVEKHNCQPSPPSPPCFSLKHINFQQALAGNGLTSALMTCSNAELRKPLWLSNNHVALMHKQSSQWQLLKYTLSDASQDILFQPRGGNLLTYDVSHSQSRIALVRLDTSHQKILDLLTIEGEPLSSNVIAQHSDIPQYKSLYPKFIPSQELLIFSTGRQLFSLSYEGKVKRINVPLDEGMSTPLFNQQGTRALATKGTYDSDIGTMEIDLSSDTAPSVVVEKQLINIARTTSSEGQAIFHPDGNIVAFKSTRSGTPQLWLDADGALTQLTELPLDSRISGFRWSKGGNSLLLNSEGELINLHLNKQYNSITLQHPVTELFHWDSDTNTAIANMLIDGVKALTEINLNNGEYLKLRDTSVLWADKSAEGRLIYLDQDYQFWAWDVAEDLALAPLSAHSSRKQFVLADEKIYGINNENFLWRYDLQKKTFSLMRNLPKNIDYLTDINNDKLLLTYVVASQKEIVELIVSN